MAQLGANAATKASGTQAVQEREKNAQHHKKKESKTLSTWPSLVVPHRGTTQARSCLTSEFGWDRVTQDDMAEREDVRCRRIFYTLVQTPLFADFDNALESSPRVMLRVCLHWFHPLHIHGPSLEAADAFIGRF